MTQTLAQISPTELAPILVILAGMLAGFYGIQKSMLAQASKDRDNDREERQALIKALDDMALSNRSIADETKQGNLEAKQRNGHLAEQNVQITELVIQAKTDTIQAIREIKEQHVVNQTIEHETILGE